MGSKNKILLGIISSIILHNIRNKFKFKELYITKRKFELIRDKHPDEHKYITSDGFQKILDNTIATCEYGKVNEITNFISFVDGRYILFGISDNNYYTYLSTLFYPSKKKLNACKMSINFFSNNAKTDFEKYLEK